MIAPGAPQQAVMFAIPQPMQAADAEATKKKYEAIPGYCPGMETAVTTASVPLFKMPKVRLSEAVEFIDPKLDVTMIAGLEGALLAVILWERTHMKPNMKLSDLRCANYLEVYVRLRCAAERRKETAQKDLSTYVEQFVQAHAENKLEESLAIEIAAISEISYFVGILKFCYFGNCRTISQNPKSRKALFRAAKDEFIMEHAIAEGFDPKWLEKDQKKQKGADKQVQAELKKMFLGKSGGVPSSAASAARQPVAPAPLPLADAAPDNSETAAPAMSAGAAAATEAARERESERALFIFIFSI